MLALQAGRVSRNERDSGCRWPALGLLALLAAGCSSEDAIDDCGDFWAKGLDGGGEEIAAAVAATPSGFSSRDAAWPRTGSDSSR